MNKNQKKVYKYFKGVRMLKRLSNFIIRSFDAISNLKILLKY